MEASDWDPLPPEQLGLHPGEDVELRIVGGREAVAPRSKPSPAEQQLLAAEVAAQTRALAELQQRIAAVPKSNTLVENLAPRPRQRARHRPAAANRKLGELAVKLDITAADLPLPVVYSEGPQGRDAREDEPWFRALPQKEQARLHDRWASDRQLDRESRKWNPKKTWRAIQNGAVVGLAIGVLLMLMGSGLAHAAGLSLLGGLGAGAAQACGGGRFAFAAVGVVAFFTVFGAAVLVSPYAMVGGMLMAYGFGALGMEREMRASGGFGDD